MVALKRPGGTFTAHWVRSHQEHELSTNTLLTAHRQALAAEDRDAAQTHEETMVRLFTGIMRGMLHTY